MTNITGSIRYDASNKPPKLERVLAQLDKSTSTGRRAIHSEEVLRSIIKSMERAPEKRVYTNALYTNALIAFLQRERILLQPVGISVVYYLDPARVAQVTPLWKEGKSSPEVSVLAQNTRLAELVKLVERYKADPSAVPVSAVLQTSFGSQLESINSLGFVQEARNEVVKTFVVQTKPRVVGESCLPGVTVKAQVVCEDQAADLCLAGIAISPTTLRWIPQTTVQPEDSIATAPSAVPSEVPAEVPSVAPPEAPSPTPTNLASVPDPPATVESRPPPSASVATTETAPVSRPPAVPRKIPEVSIVCATLASGPEQNTLTLQVSEGPLGEAQDHFGSLHVLSDLLDDQLAERRTLTCNIAAYAAAGQAAIGAEIRRRETQRQELEAANRAHANLLGRHLSMADRRTTLLARAARLREEVEAGRTST